MIQLDLRDIPVYCIKSTNIFDQQISNLKDNGFKNVNPIKTDYRNDTSISEQINQTIQYKLSLEYLILQNITTPFILLENSASLYNNNYIVQYPEITDAIYLGLFRYGFDNLEVDYNKSQGNNTIIAKYIEQYNIYQIYNMLGMYAIFYNNYNYLERSLYAISLMIEKSLHGSRGLSSIMKYYNIYALPQPIFYNKLVEKDTKILMDEINIRDLFF